MDGIQDPEHAPICVVNARYNVLYSNQTAEMLAFSDRARKTFTRPFQRAGVWMPLMCCRGALPSSSMTVIGGEGYTFIET